MMIITSVCQVPAIMNSLIVKCSEVDKVPIEYKLQICITEAAKALGIHFHEDPGSIARSLVGAAPSGK